MKRISRGMIPLVALAALLAFLPGCYPDESAGVGRLDIVLTDYDPAFSFGGVDTYIMPDTVISVINPDDPAQNKTYSHAYDSAILAAFAGGFSDAGYRRLTDTLTEKPDVGVVVTVVSNTSTGAYWSEWNSSWGWYPWWPPDYGASSGTYYPWVATYSFSTGTVVATMIDLNRGVALHSDSVFVVWLGAVNGLAEGSDIQARVVSGISQMFKQSPYL